MNIQNPTTEEMAQAADAINHYKDVLKRGKSYSSAEDELMLAMYRQIAAGRQVVNAFNLLTGGGVDELGRPRLFLARANWRRVVWRDTGQGAGKFRDFSKGFWDRGKRHILELPHNTLPRKQTTTDDAWSVVPSIPPLLRPRGRLDGYIILSEAAWQAVPKDPALLRPIKWPLCAVLAVWDLTELERKVLGITRIE